MKTEFLNSADDVQWLKETHLRGVPLPADWCEFASFVLQGNEDSPHAVNLYSDQNPRFDDDFLRVRFVNETGAYAEYCRYDGKTNKPIGGLSQLL